VSLGCLKEINATLIGPWYGRQGVYEFKNKATTKDLKELIKVKGSEIKELNLCWCKNIDLTPIDWENCKNLERLDLDLSFPDVTASGLQKILMACLNLKKLDLCWHERSTKYRRRYASKKDIEKLKKDLETEVQKLDSKASTEALKELIRGPELETLSTVVTTTKDLKEWIEIEGSVSKELNLCWCKNIDFTQIDWESCKNLETLSLRDSNIEAFGLQKILTSCLSLKELNLDCCKNIDFTQIDWKNCKKLNLLKDLNLRQTNIHPTELRKFINLLSFDNQFLKLNLNGCKNLGHNTNLQNEYKSRDDYSTFITDLSKAVAEDHSWFAKKWQALLPSWKWAMGVGAVVIPLIGALIFYKRSQTIQNFSSALWHRLPSFLKRQKTVNQPLIAQNRFKI